MEKDPPAIHCNFKNWANSLFFNGGSILALKNDFSNVKDIGEKFPLLILKIVMSKKLKKFGDAPGGKLPNSRCRKLAKRREKFWKKENLRKEMKSAERRGEKGKMQLNNGMKIPISNC
jgi:hypothetical protein